VSEFLRGLGHHLRDMDRNEALTLAPLVVLTIAFGLFPGLLLNLFTVPVNEFLASVGSGPLVGAP
jgi:NADH:ubiquinone oxidoreductase subunit 4 (subunit M)